MFPESNLELKVSYVTPTQQWKICAVRKDGQSITLATTPQDLVALMQLGLIEDITKLVMCLEKGCANRAIGRLNQKPLCNEHYTIKKQEAIKSATLQPTPPATDITPEEKSRIAGLADGSIIPTPPKDPAKEIVVPTPLIAKTE